MDVALKVGVVIDSLAWRVAIDVGDVCGKHTRPHHLLECNGQQIELHAEKHVDVGKQSRTSNNNYQFQDTSRANTGCDLQPV